MRKQAQTWLLAAALAATSCSPEVLAPIPGPAKSHLAPPVKDCPASRRDDLVERLHGTEVKDPYRWLEDPTRPEVVAWMTAQDDYARAHLAKLSGRDAIAKKLASVMYYDSVSAPIHRGGLYFYARKHRDKEKRVVYWKAGETGAERVLLDPNTWSSDDSVGLKRWSVSWDGNYVAYNVSEHNADETSLSMLEVLTGRQLPDTIPHVRFGSVSWTPDNRGFYYTYTPPASGEIAESERSAHTELRFHTLGSPPARDPMIRVAAGIAGWFINSRVSEDGHWLFVSVSRGSSGSEDWYFQDLRASKPRWVTLVEGVEANFIVADFRDRFYVATNDGAQRGHLLVVDPARPARANWLEIVAQTDATLEDEDVIGGQLVLSYLRNASSALEVHGLDGKLVRQISLPPFGTLFGVVGRADEDTVYFGYSSFTQPSIVYRTSIKTGEIVEWSRVTLPFDTRRFVTDQVRYPSRDGTLVTMFIVHARDAIKTRALPTLMTAYGGFRISITPEFSPRYAVWLDMGGVVAVPNLRGGGEYGEAWHRAGMLANKQNVFDDFIAAARYLETNGWTTPDKLAIYGGSNGGLLVGAVTVQAPEKFKAVVCSVPLLDMVRYHKFGLGKSWISEYGTSDEKADFKFLYAYSPYHHVSASERYPAFLMLSADHDDRVDPMHARKFTAALQAASSAPVWLRIERNAAHGGADVVRQLVEQWADVLTFVWHALAGDPPTRR